MKIFWSWQSDRPKKTGQFFVRDALKAAAKALNVELEVEASDRLDVDSDTQDLPGTPSVVASIYGKIEDATVFVADVTPVGVTDDGKLLPNPNVMKEFGYARRARGWERLLTVANGHYLPRVEDLPFDMRGDRGPATYTLAPDADKDAIKAETARFVPVLKQRLRAIVEHERQVREAQDAAALEAVVDDRTQWFEPGQVLTFRDILAKGGTGEVTFPEEPYGYMRVKPAHWPRTRSAALKPASGSLAIGGAPNGHDGQTDMGWLEYRMLAVDGPPDQAEVLVWSDAETGEIWALWCNLVQEPNWFYGGDLMEHWTRFLPAAITRLGARGAQGPFRVDAGAAGLAGTRWNMLIADDMKTSVGDSVREIVVVTGEASSQDEGLAEVCSALVDKFGFGKITSEQVAEMRRL